MRSGDEAIVTVSAGDSEVCVTYFLLVVNVGGRFRAKILHQAANNGISSVLHLKGSKNRAALFNDDDDDNSHNRKYNTDETRGKKQQQDGE